MKSQYLVLIICLHVVRGQYLPTYESRSPIVQSFVSNEFYDSTNVSGGTPETQEVENEINQFSDVKNIAVMQRQRMQNLLQEQREFEKKVELESRKQLSEKRKLQRKIQHELMRLREKYKEERKNPQANEYILQKKFKEEEINLRNNLNQEVQNYLQNKASAEYNLEIERRQLKAELEAEKRLQIRQNEMLGVKLNQAYKTPLQSQQKNIFSQNKQHVAEQNKGNKNHKQIPKFKDLQHKIINKINLLDEESAKLNIISTPEVKIYARKKLEEQKMILQTFLRFISILITQNNSYSNDINSGSINGDTCCLNGVSSIASHSNTADPYDEIYSSLRRSGSPVATVPDLSDGPVLSSTELSDPSVSSTFPDSTGSTETSGTSGPTETIGSTVNTVTGNDVFFDERTKNLSLQTAYIMSKKTNDREKSFNKLDSINNEFSFETKPTSGEPGGLGINLGKEISPYFTTVIDQLTAPSHVTFTIAPLENVSDAIVDMTLKNGSYPVGIDINSLTDVTGLNSTITVGAFLTDDDTANADADTTLAAISGSTMLSDTSTNANNTGHLNSDTNFMTLEVKRINADENSSPTTTADITTDTNIIGPTEMTSGAMNETNTIEITYINGKETIITSDRITDTNINRNTVTTPDKSAAMDANVTPNLSLHSNTDTHTAGTAGLITTTTPIGSGSSLVHATVNITSETYRDSSLLNEIEALLAYVDVAP